MGFNDEFPVNEDMREENFKCDASSPHPSSSSLSQSKFEVEVKLRIKILEEENKHLKMENKLKFQGTSAPVVVIPLQQKQRII